MLTRLTRNRTALIGMLSSVVLTLLLAVVLIPGQNAKAAANAPAAAPNLNIFAKILVSTGNPINGDSTAKGFEKQIPVQSFSFASMNSAPTGGGAGTGAGTGAGKTIASPITFTAAAGSDSPLLIKALVPHTVLQTAVFSFVHPGGESTTPFQKYTLSNCSIVSFHQTATENGVVVDEIQITFTKVTYDFILQKPDGTSTTTTVTWDIKANKAA